MGLRRDSVPRALLGRSGVGRGRTENVQRDRQPRGKVEGEFCTRPRLARCCFAPCAVHCTGACTLLSPVLSGHLSGVKLGVSKI